MAPSAALARAGAAVTAAAAQPGAQQLRVAATAATAALLRGLQQAAAAAESGTAAPAAPPLPDRAAEGGRAAAAEAAAPLRPRCDPCGCGGPAGAQAAAAAEAAPLACATGTPGPWAALLRQAYGGSASSKSGDAGAGGGGAKPGRPGRAPAPPPPPAPASPDSSPDPLAAALSGGGAAARGLRLDLGRGLLGPQAHPAGPAGCAAARQLLCLRPTLWFGLGHQLDPAAAREVVPRNILMIGPTGCGKTEIARRLARLVDAPFIKVEATKFTELGYVGRDVDDIVKDLAEAAMATTRTRLKAALAVRAASSAEERILRDLCGELAETGVYETFRQLYREGALDDRTVELALTPPGAGGGGPEASLLATLERLGLSPPRGGGGGGGRRGGSGGGGGGQKQRMKVRDARQLLVDQEAEKWLSSELVAREAVRSAQEDGIVFIDEIDKIAVRGGVGSGGSVSSEGVQRDLLPILEGSTVSTKYGNVCTDHVLFIASGAFHSAKPSDMLAELQGRLPVRVELKGLTAADFHRILTEPKNNMIAQQRALLATEGVCLSFTDGAVAAVASAAEEANRLLDNIGARRLHTVLERVLADISFSAPEKAAAARAAAAAAEDGGGGGGVAEGGGGGEALPVRVEVTAEDVRSAVGPLLEKVDLSKYML
ncbi:ATP-dependent protease ATP-binding subunit [Raphidocelis subcapitata]|uniref:ATP-dependent protease ATP-binding subunit n=1 Tax=Raphidocelis subcapitata TaxID=307507 RepID=A0A2V0PIX6_9CHLO|nr:ATP-dependent protease ATP-binding subunit [Raphidocelis subcapitata]|eukprot:GBF99764.1 ATP-dependent protease ATP-binding subunit [Raphidocelis subcapitata]